MREKRAPGLFVTPWKNKHTTFVCYKCYKLHHCQEPKANYLTKKSIGKAPAIHPGAEPPFVFKAVEIELAFETQQEYTASAMSKKKPKSKHPEKEPRRTTPTFLLELPLVVHEGQATRLRAHLEAGRQFYNAVLSAGQKRLRRMRTDPAWQEARAIPRTQKQERTAAFATLREQYGFSEYAFHDLARKLCTSFLADHLDAVLAQTLATRAYRALNRVCVGEARRVRFKSKSRGLDSIENKRNDTGLRFVLQKAEVGNAGHLIWKEDHLPVLIDWRDEVVAYGLRQRIKYVRLVQRRASSDRAAGANHEAYRYFVQLALEGIPLQKPKHAVGQDIIGVDLGPSTIAMVPRAGEASLEPLCEELSPNSQQIRRLQRRMERQRRAANPDNYDAKGHIKKQGKQRLRWKTSKSYEQTRRRKAAKERKLAAHRKSLHGRKVHEIVAMGNTIIIEKLSYKAWQKQYGRSVGLRAPGMFVGQLRRTVASTGGTLIARPDAACETLAVLSWMREARQKAALAALASLPLWSRSRAAGSLCGVSSLHALSRSSDPVMCPGCHSLGKCGGALAGRACTGTPTGE